MIRVTRSKCCAGRIRLIIGRWGTCLTTKESLFLRQDLLVLVEKVNASDRRKLCRSLSRSEKAHS